MNVAIVSIRTFWAGKKGQGSGGREGLQGLNVLHVGSVRPKNDVTNPSDQAEDSIGIYGRPLTATDIELQRFF